MRSSDPSSVPSSKTASKPGKSTRLNKFLADAGICSRRRADELIAEAKVSVNGTVCTDLSTKIDPSVDSVICEGVRVSFKKDKIYLMLFKPRGLPVTKSDEFGRKTIYSLLPKEFHQLNYAGRLDMDSEGLLLLTNDGDLIQSLSHPSMRVEKVYRVEINKTLTRKELEQLRQGVVIEGKKTLSAGVFVKRSDDGKSVLKMVITEGRKRQIRHMIESVGARVLALKRLQFGPLMLKDLSPGQWRPLSRHEIIALKKIKEKDTSKT